MKPCDISVLIPNLHIHNNRAKIFAANSALASNSALKENLSLPVATKKQC